MCAHVAAGCASSPPGAEATVIRTLHDASIRQTPFSNVLVIGVAGDYPLRAQFEGAIVAEITGEETTATAWYTVVGRRPQLGRSALNTAIRAREFDAVLLTRVKGQDLADAAPGRPTGLQMNLFDYDYPEFNVPADIRKAPTINFVTELYRASDRRKVWSIDTLSYDKESPQALIEEQAETIARALIEDGVVLD